MAMAEGCNASHTRPGGWNSIRRVEAGRRFPDGYQTEVDALNFFYDLAGARNRKRTRLNSSHANNSYAIFSLKKKSSGLVQGVPVPITSAGEVEIGRAHL